MVKLTDKQWYERLTPLQYHILRERGTEEPFTGEFLSDKKDGTYVCAACGAKLFKSGHKFESGTGWPSFYDIFSSDAIKLKEDHNRGMERIEVSCANCGSHLGHVFHDAPDQPTGMRFCINSASLNFKPLGKSKKDAKNKLSK